MRVYVSQKTGELCESLLEVVKAIVLNFKHCKFLDWKWEVMHVG